MGIGRFFNLSNLVFSSVCAAGVLASASISMAQSQGITGFDWIGTDPANVDNQRCYASNQWDDGNYNRTLTAWTPPASGNQYIFWNYSLTDFRAQIGSIPINFQNPSHPSDYAGWQLYVYDSFDQFRLNPLVNFRAKLTFSRTSPSITYQNSLGCRFWSTGSTYPIPCYRLTLNLTQPTTAEYKTPNGQVTALPLRLTGGVRYWFALVGVRDINVAELPCVVRTNPDLGQTASPMPNPPVSFAMNASQCVEAGLGQNCSFPLSHSDFQKTSNSLCNTQRTAVNYLQGYSSLDPLLNPNSNGSLPRTCGGANQTPCCERTQSSHWAKALGVTRTITHLHRFLATTAAIAAVDPCIYPNC